MQQHELRALGGIAGEALGRSGEAIGEVHRGVASRVFGALGPMAAPVRVAHDAIAGGVHAYVRAAMRAVPRAGGAALVRLTPPDAVSMAETPHGSIALGALNGAFGDALARTHRALTLDLSIRSGGSDVVTDTAGLARAYPDATPRLAVFVHGLCETDTAWRIGGPAYGSRLRDDLGHTPLYVRYNTGLHISDNGHRLAEVLDHVICGWPVEVEEVVLVGHSMGGLVARSACHYGHASNSDWTRRIRHVFCLGTPHLGAPLERAANVAGWALGRLPETRGFGAMVNGRSAGIKDLRYGSCVEEDWCDCDRDEFLNDRCNEVPFLATASYYFVGATLTREPNSPFASIVGDLLVQFASASGNGPKRRIPFEIENGRHVGGINHFQLLNHPAVYEQLHRWLVRGATPRLPALAQVSSNE